MYSVTALAIAHSNDAALAKFAKLPEGFVPALDNLGAFSAVMRGEMSRAHWHRLMIERPGGDYEIGLNAGRPTIAAAPW